MAGMSTGPGAELWLSLDPVTGMAKAPRRKWRWTSGGSGRLWFQRSFWPLCRDQVQEKVEERWRRGVEVSQE